MGKLVKYEMDLPYSSDDDFLRAQENLKKNMKNKSFFRDNPFHPYFGLTFSDDYSGKNLRRSNYDNCKFISSNLTNAGFSGSIFLSTNFHDSTLVNTNLDSCEFNGCNFSNRKPDQFRNVNFSKSIIFDSSFVECEMEATNFTDTMFRDVKFENCIWSSVSLENATFINTEFDSITLKKLNFEFAQFHNVRMNNIRLPFPTIPYIINGLTYLMNTTDDVWISSAQSPVGKITVAEYLTYLDDMEIFYIKTHNYFPLANIYIAKKQWDKAFAAVLHGINFSIKLRNFRLVNYYCKLLKLTKDFDNHMLSHAYNYIMENTDNSNWRIQDRHTYSLYIDSIRNSLMKAREPGSLRFSINTNIACKEHNKLTILTSIIDDIIKLAENYTDSKTRYYIEVRHNSPFELFIEFFGTKEPLFYVLGVTYLTLWGSISFAKGIQECCGRHLDNRIKKQNIEKAQLEIEERKLAIQERDIEITKQKSKKPKKNYDTESQTKGLELNEKLISYNIAIQSGGHTWLIDDGGMYDKTIVHYYRN